MTELIFVTQLYIGFMLILAWKERDAGLVRVR